MTDSVSNPSRKADAVEFPAPGSLHAAALAYASRGWPVFPCVPLGKQPACEHGQHDATTDPERINAWWAENPSYNVAVFLEPTGLCVVDLDGGAGIAEFADIEFREGLTPDTLSIRTPRGGEHRYFRGALPPTQHRIAPHIDTRGQRSYVLLPSSRTADGSYSVINDTQPAELPEWISRLAVARDVAVTTAPANFDPAGQVPRFLARLADLVKRGDVARQDEGGNTRTFRLFCEAKEIGLSREMALALVTEHWNPACEPPWDTDELLTIAGNAYRYAQNTEGAYATPAPSQVWGGVVDKLPAGGIAQTIGTMVASITGTLSTLVTKLGSRTLSEWLAMPAASYWDAERTYPKGGAIGLLTGKWGALKTTTVLSDIVPLAAQEHGPIVLYLAGEGNRGVATRVADLCRRQGIDPARLDDRFIIANGIPQFMNAEDVDFVITYYRDRGVRIVIFDTLATATAGIEENSSAFGAMVSGNGAVGTILRGLNAETAIVVAHLGKDEERGTRGHSSTEGNADFVLRMKYDGKATRTGSKIVEKMRDGEAQRCVRYLYSPGCSGAPTGIVIPEARYQELKTGADTYRTTVLRALTSLGAFGDGEPVTTEALAEEIAGLPHRDGDKRLRSREIEEAIGRATERLARRMRQRDGKPSDLADLFACYSHPAGVPKRKWWRIPDGEEVP